VADPKAYLTRIVANVALERLRSARHQRETYVGPWLPEPVLTGGDVSEVVTDAESVSMAMLVVLETLTPLERTVFVLHEVFGYGHAEIAASVGRSEVAVRQIASRARAHVQARRRRFEPDSESARSVVRRFLNAARSGEVRQLMELMSPDVVTFSDGRRQSHRRAPADHRPCRGGEVRRWCGQGRQRDRCGSSPRTRSTGCWPSRSTTGSSPASTAYETPTS
jgi:hypothetical protein